MIHGEMRSRRRRRNSEKILRGELVLKQLI
jgi:hypothetical protein